jgi:GIY-YIG catalytic domain
MDRSEAKKDYKQAKRPMEVYRIRNTRNGKSYVGFSTDLQARINRQKTELKFGSHRNTRLLREWKSFGESSFEFEVLDELAHAENSAADPTEELRILTEMWIRKLDKAGSSVVSL